MSDQDPMTAAHPTPDLDPTTAAPERAAEQVKADAWPIPGDEGYVHPDGTPQSVVQLADNQRAAADRAAAGSIVHGAPSPARGGDPDAVTIAAQRAEDYSGPSTADARADLTQSVREGLDANAERGAVPVETAADDAAVARGSSAGAGEAPVKATPAKATATTRSEK